MNNEEVLEIIKTQQEKCKESPAFFVGMQLADIVRSTPGAADLVGKDLMQEGMGIVDCEKKIAEFARKHARGRCGFCGQQDSDRIIREFYGIQKTSGESENHTPAEPASQKKPGISVNLLDFLD